MWLLASGLRAQVQPFGTGLSRLRDHTAFGQIEIPAELLTSGGRPKLANELLGAHGPRTLLAAALSPTTSLIELSLEMAGVSTRRKCSSVNSKRQQMKGHRGIQHDRFDGRIKQQGTIRFPTHALRVSTMRVKATRLAPSIWAVERRAYPGGGASAVSESSNDGNHS